VEPSSDASSVTTKVVHPNPEGIKIIRTRIMMRDALDTIMIECFSRDYMNTMRMTDVVEWVSIKNRVICNLFNEQNIFHAI